MSSPAAGKFQDHYKLLAIDPKADQAAIDLAYSRLMACQPNAEEIEALKLALEVLSDPAARKIFDAVRGGGNEDDREINFSGLDFFDNLKGERARRATLLCVLYDVRRLNPRVPLITMRQLEQVVRLTEEEIQMALWYLKTLGWVVVDDKSKMQITAQGVDFLEQNTPDPGEIWPYLKMAPPEKQEKAAVAVAAEITPLPLPPPPPAPIPTPAPSPMPAPEPPIVQPEPPKLKPIAMLRRAQVSVT
ncbi:hypothetical protein [Bryobacter aggregatus]|uniref:hypothetical protein n=1 Tax=Bryobacter aggregatus TaxID=360054 RepID=UPI0005649160|nr:hypothetical protein [Bryobacter aggregatus]